MKERALIYLSNEVFARMIPVPSVLLALYFSITINQIAKALAHV